MIHTTVVGKSGRTWIIEMQVNAADRIHVTNNSTNTTKQGGGNGYGGATITFKTTDGEFAANCPWHSNAESLLSDTNLDLRSLHMTSVTVSTERAKDLSSHKGGEVLYEETVPVLGVFNRGEQIAQALADLYKKPLWCYSKSSSGSSYRLIEPKGN